MARNCARLLTTLVATATATAGLLPGACGGQTSRTSENGDSGAGSGSSSGSDSGYVATSSSGSPSTSSSSSGSGSGSGSSGSSGGPIFPACTSNTFAVNPTKCEPQLVFEQFVELNDGGAALCALNIEQPCAGDAGIDSVDACAACAVYEDAGSTFGSCNAAPLPDGGFMVYCGGCCIGGRASRGFSPRRGRSAGRAGVRLARMAQVEAASVGAFGALHDDLARLGAPRRLLAAVRIAAKDEVRHARSVRRLAERFGACVPRAGDGLVASRSLQQLAIENAEEGCVRETFGAAIAAVQAVRASDLDVRRRMRGIARDELRHAALAWRISDWLEARLDARARARVRRARLTALKTLGTGVAAEGAGDDVLGIPDAEGQLAVLEHLWSALATGDLATPRSPPRRRTSALARPTA